jgi:hypothetical protein
MRQMPTRLRTPEVDPLRPRHFLDRSESAPLRDRLIAELEALQSGEEAATWAQRSLPAKNTLTTEDAPLVEAAFAVRVALFNDREPAVDRAEGPLAQPKGLPGQILDHAQSPAAIHDLNTVTIPTRRHRLTAKTTRVRDKAHRRFVSAQPCVVCGRHPCDPHHLRCSACGTRPI